MTSTALLINGTRDLFSTPADTETLKTIRELVKRGALFVVSHSGGKDSQAMLIEVLRHVPRDQIVLVHVDMLNMEWPGTWDHVEAYSYGLPLYRVAANFKDGSPKSLLDMVRARHTTLVAANRNQSPWPSPNCRQCTSDLKRDPIQKFIRNYLKANPRFNGLVVDCVGLRAEESSDRAALTDLELATDKGRAAAGREWWTWLPVHGWSVERIFGEIAAAGQEPHYCYSLGVSRASCAFCIMATQKDLRIAAEHLPDLYRQYVELEALTGFTLSMSRKGLEDVTGVRLVDLLEAA